MEKQEKFELITKLLRELDDIKSSETSVLKKIAQVEAENINLGNGILEKRLPDLHEISDNSITAIDALIAEFTTYKDQFVKEHNIVEEGSEA